MTVILDAVFHRSVSLRVAVTTTSERSWYARALCSGEFSARICVVTAAAASTDRTILPEPRYGLVLIILSVVDERPHDAMHPLPRRKHSEPEMRKDEMDLPLLLFCEEVLARWSAHAAARMRNKSGKCSDSWLMAFEGRPSSRLHPGQAPDWRLGSRIQLQQRNCSRFSRDSFHRSICYISAKNYRPSTPSLDSIDKFILKTEAIPDFIAPTKQTITNRSMGRNSLRP